MNNISELSLSKNTWIETNPFSSGNEKKVKDEAIDKLINEGGEDFFRYFKSTDHSSDSNVIVLSSQHHYYYDSDELRGVKSVVILKKLNRVKEIESFLQSHLSFLPNKCNVIGCFVNNIKIKRYALRTGGSHTEKTKISEHVNLDIVSRFPFLNMIYSLMDFKTNTYMSDDVVTFLLAVHGFKVMNMTESNGLTYFHARRDVSLITSN